MLAVVLVLLFGLGAAAPAAPRVDAFCPAYLRWVDAHYAGDLAEARAIVRAAAPAELRADVVLVSEEPPGADLVPARTRIDSWLGTRCGWPTAHALVADDAIVGLEHDLPEGPLTLVVRSRVGSQNMRLTRADETSRTLAAFTVADTAVVHVDLRRGTHTLRIDDRRPALVIVR